MQNRITVGLLPLLACLSAVSADAQFIELTQYATLSCDINATITRGGGSTDCDATTSSTYALPAEVGASAQGEGRGSCGNYQFYTRDFLEVYMLERDNNSIRAAAAHLETEIVIHYPDGAWVTVATHREDGFWMLREGSYEYEIPVINSPGVSFQSGRVKCRYEGSVGE